MANSKRAQHSEMRTSKRRPKSSPSLASPARVCAYEILTAMRTTNKYFSRVAPKILSSFKLSAEDKAFAILLSRGVVSTCGSLDELIDSVLNNPKDVQPNVREALRIGAYELFYLKKEAYAVVDQTVELVRYASPRAARLGNFVMRKLSSQVSLFPYGNAEKSLKAASLKEGFPLWLATQLENDMGHNQARTFMAYSNNQAPVFFTINENRVDAQKVQDALTKNGIEYERYSLNKAHAIADEAQTTQAP
ncbi:MAG: transcription antitermination factor NusB, partial [Anaerotardibacter sp.]